MNLHTYVIGIYIGLCGAQFQINSDLLNTVNNFLRPLGLGSIRIIPAGSGTPARPPQNPPPPTPPRRRPPPRQPPPRPRQPPPSSSPCPGGCDAGFVCYGGGCQKMGHSLCNPMCEEDYTCHHGHCHYEPCRPRCGRNRRCLNGKCESVPCRPRCQNGDVCDGGVCVPDNRAECPGGCPPGYKCHDGHCDSLTMDPHHNVCNPPCSPNSRCENGHCIGDVLTVGEISPSDVRPISSRGQPPFPPNQGFPGSGQDTRREIVRPPSPRIIPNRDILTIPRIPDHFDPGMIRRRDSAGSIIIPTGIPPDPRRPPFTQGTIRSGGGFQRNDIGRTPNNIRPREPFVPQPIDRRPLPQPGRETAPPRGGLQLPPIDSLGLGPVDPPPIPSIEEVCRGGNCVGNGVQNNRNRPVPGQSPGDKRCGRNICTDLEFCFDAASHTCMGSSSGDPRTLA